MNFDGEFRDKGANGVRSVLEDANGDFWVTTETRFRVYDDTTTEKENFYTRLEGLGSLDSKPGGKLDEDLSSRKDRRGNLWFVSYQDGAWLYDGKQVRHQEVELKGQQLSLFSIYEDRQGGLWLGTHEDGVYHFTGEGVEPFQP